MGKFNMIIHKISINFVIILFAIICIGMFFTNSIYINTTDTPSFVINNVWNYLAIIINIIGVVILLLVNKFLKNKFPESKKVTVILFALYFIAEFIFLKLVPIKPFSDMQGVVSAAVSNFKEGMEYIYLFPNNLPISVVFFFLFKIYKGVMVVKITNVICGILTIYFAYKTYENIYKKENKLVLLFGMFSIPTFLYVNHLYNDVIFVALTTAILYIITKQESKKKDIVLLVILSFIQFFIRQVGIILIIAEAMYLILKKQNYKAVLAIGIVCIVFQAIYVTQVENRLIPENEKEKSCKVWSFIEVGLNEEKFGFQDGSYSPKWKARDIVERVKTLGVKKLMTLLAKKEYWMWTEGTYQVQRYAFGNGLPDLFYYETPITLKVSNPETSKIRKALDYIMKAQYFILILLSLIDLIVRDKEKETKNKKDLLLYFIVGMFCFYIVMEMKSRYIYCLQPIFLILATSGIEKIQCKINEYKRKI